MNEPGRSPRGGFDATSVVLTVIAAGTIMRFILASAIGLGVDESYAVVVARQWSLSYFDHPPLHFWLAGLVARLANTEAPAVVRLPFTLCFAATTWFMFRLTTRLFDERAGAVAAVLLNISAVFSLSTGGWVLPDGPLMALMMATSLLLVTILFDEAPSYPLLRWAGAGLLAGLALLTKYHGVFLLAGTFVFLVSSAPHRRWLRTAGPYLGAVVAAICFLPVVLWNERHGWVSLVFQGGRASGSGVHVGTMLTNIGGQAAWVLPWIWIPLVVAAWTALRAGPGDSRRWFLLCLGGGPVVVFTLVALRGNVGLPHWQAPGYLLFFPLLGAVVQQRLSAGDRVTRHWLELSVATFVVLVFVLGSHTSTGSLARLLPGAFTKGDPTADAVDWRLLRTALKQRGLLPIDGFVAAPSWIQAGKAGYGIGPDVPVLCLCADPHHFYYASIDTTWLGRNAVIVEKVRPNDDVIAEFAPYFEQILPLDVIPITRGGQIVMDVAIYRARNFRRVFPTSQPR